MNGIENYIESIYQRALSLDTIEALDLSDNSKNNIDEIVAASENSKGVLAVTATSLIYKSLHP